MSAVSRTKHGHTTATTQSHEYRCWACMKQRCFNPNATGFKYYGGRGITVCERWRSFAAFLADMGQAPSKQHSLDRKESDGHYEPGNVRWATKSEQFANQRHCGPPQKLTMEGAREIRRLRGQGLTQRQIAAQFSVHQTTVHHVWVGRTWKESDCGGQ